MVEFPRRNARAMLLVGGLVLLECLRQLSFVALGPASVVLDSAEYWRSGQAVAAGDWLQLTVNTPYRTPVYPYWLSLPQWMCGRWALLTVVLGQHLVVLATTLLTCLMPVWWTRRWGPGVLAYLLFWPLMARFWYANAILTETLFALPFTAGMGMLLGAGPQPSAIRTLWAGILLGLATLIRPVPQLLIPVLALLWLVAGLFGWQGRSWRQTGWQAVILGGTFGLVLLPCFVRNQSMYGRPFLTKLPAVNRWAVAFRDGSGGDLPWPESSAAKRMESLLQVPAGVLQDRHGSLVQQDLLAVGQTVEQSETLMAQVSMDAIYQHPSPFLWKAFKRVINFWRCTSNTPPYGGSERPDFQQQAVWRISILEPLGEFFYEHLPSQSLWWTQLFSLFSWLAVFRLCWLPRHRWQGVVLLATFGYFCTLTGLVEIENYRYRMVLEPLLVWSIVLAVTASGGDAGQGGPSAGERDS